MSLSPSKSRSQSSVWTENKNKMKGYTRLTGKVSKRTVDSHEDVEEELPPSEHVSATNLDKQVAPSRSRSFTEEDEYLTTAEIPPDFAILPVYQEILDEPLPPMELFPPFLVEDDQIDVVVGKMDSRLRRNPTYKSFLDETRGLLTYVLQEVKLRKTIQSRLVHREGEMKSMIEQHKRDPRVCKVLLLADHWRSEKENSEEKIQTLMLDINTLTMDLKLMENKLSSMLKRQEKMESQLQKNRGCDQEKERLEEQIMVREKAILDMAEHVDHLKNTVNTMTTEALHKEHEFRLKLEAAPDRNAVKVAALTRELEVMSLEKEYKVQEARELHHHVNALIVKNSRTSDRVKLLMGSVRALKLQVRSVEFKHQVVVVKNKGLNRQLNASVAFAKSKEYDAVDLHKENLILKKKLQEVQTQLKVEKTRYTSVVRSVGVLETENQALKTELKEKKLTNKNLENGLRDAMKQANVFETSANSAARLHQKESQRAKELYRKVTTSGRHIRMALHNINIMSDEIDKTGQKIRVLDAELMRCQDENVRNNSTVTHLYRVLENTENLVRLQTRENDALIISKNRLVDSLKICFNSRKKMQNEVSRLRNDKTSLEDAQITHKFMLDFVESERDGALRNVKHYVDAVVILERKQVAKIAEIARANGESSQLRLQLEDMQKQLNVQKREVYNLNKTLKVAEINFKDMETTCMKLMLQRDMFGGRILQQNNEAELTQMKMDTMQRALDKGNTLYRDRCNDITVLRKEIQNLRRRIKSLEHTESLCHELRTEIACLTKNMCLEMNKRAAIERCKMTKVHRHRELQSSNPSMYEMVVKIQVLQKLVIRKTQDCIAKEKEIAIRNDSIKTLEKAILRREKIKQKQSDTNLRTVVERKEQKIKALRGELGMMQSYLDAKSKLTEEQRRELSTVRREINQLRRSKSASTSSASERWSSQDTATGSSESPSAGKPQGLVFRPGRPSGSQDSPQENATPAPRTPKDPPGPRPSPL